MKKRLYPPIIEGTLPAFSLASVEVSEDKDITTWVILDDEMFEFFDNEETKNHIIQTHGIDGLTEEDVENALKVLRGEEFECTPIYYY